MDVSHKTPAIRAVLVQDFLELLSAQCTAKESSAVSVNGVLPLWVHGVASERMTLISSKMTNSQADHAGIESPWSMLRIFMA
jgi:hypothetical protein